MTHLTLALDTMGGDHGPHVTVPAALQALSVYADLHLILVGDRPTILSILRQHQACESERLRILHAEQVVQMGDKPLHALRRLKHSSMRLALDLVANGQAHACVSAGNTGALMTMAKVVLKTLPGVDRPALVTALPTMTGDPVYLMDLGANASCDSHALFQFAVMGSVLAEQVANKSNPRVALLNIGTEEIKGNDQVQQASGLLQSTPHINYTGYVEGDRIFSGEADVIVCDGFVGNVTLKTTEGIARLLMHQIAQSVKRNPLARCLSWLLKGRLKKLFLQMNPDHYNGASLLGLRHIVVKSHGNADELAFLRAVEEAMTEVQRQVPGKIEARLESVLLEKSC
ncbi:phosphate acyltransferase PlsX [Ferrimonas futtsuensis]|uniref:phosphate acyltransferase PlsX n=1 Tax=Ferrimonas futtsuensis TaxID=364764 RepID=UPI0004888738|nr:phosphate acyltransferase PlsX [Ferrimonas futtsuensis]